MIAQLSALLDYYLMWCVRRRTNPAGFRSPHHALHCNETAISLSGNVQSGQLRSPRPDPEDPSGASGDPPIPDTAAVAARMIGLCQKRW